MSISFDLADFCELVPYSIILNTEMSVISLGSGFIQFHDVVGRYKLCELFSYFDISEFNFEGNIEFGRDYVIWRRGFEQVAKGMFQHFPGKDIVIFVGKRISNNYDVFNINALIFCKEMEEKLRKVYGSRVDMPRFFHEFMSSNSVDKDSYIDLFYGVTLSDSFGKVIWCNQAFIDISERTYEEIIGKRPRDAIYSKRSVYIDSDYVDLMVAKGKPFYFENLGTSALGRQFWFGASVFPVFDINGSIIGRIHFLRDISERKVKDIIVEENESLLQLCIDAAKIGLWSIDAKTFELTVNSQFKNLIHLSSGSEVSLAMIREWTKSSKQIKYLETALRKVSPMQPYIKLSRLMLEFDREVHFYNLNAIVIKFDTKGSPLRIVGTLTDATEEQNREQLIIQQKEFYESILNKLPADIAIFSTDHKYNYVNENAIANPSIRKWIINKDDFDYCREKKQDDSFALQRREFFQKAVETGSEVRFVEKDAHSAKYALRVFNPIKNSRGNIKYVIGYGIDVSEQIRAIEKEKQLTEHKNHFIKVTSHELRTPLTIIYSNAEMLEILCETESQSNNKSVYIRRILNEVNAMIEILNELILVSRIENNRIEISRDPINISKFVADIVTPFMPFKDGRTLELNIDENVSVWNFDGRLLKHAIVNLLVNAFKYSRGRQNPILMICIKNNQLLIRVTDFGIGIPPNEINSIFSSFYRGSNVGTIQGSGVGLMIVQYAVNKHNGKIDVQSQVNIGTEITISIPK